MKTLNHIKQKTLRLLAMLPAVAALAVLSACSTEDGEGTQQAWNGEIRLVAATTAGTTRAATGVQATQFNRGQLLSVYLFEAGDESSTFYTNPLTYRVNDDQGTLSAYGVAAPQFPLTNGVDVYALYPSTVKRESTSFSVKTQQADDDSYCASDLMYGTVLDGDGNRQSVARSADAAELTFKHMLSKIVVKLEPGSGAPDVNGATVRLQNVKPEIGITSCGLNGLALGAAAGDKQDIVVTYSYNYDTDNDGSAAIIVPQTIDAGKFMRISLKNGTTMTYRLPENTTFASGYVYTYIVTCNTSGLAVRGLVEPWDEVEDIIGRQYTIGDTENEKEITFGTVEATVGDIYYADGTISATLEDGHGEPIGMVAYVGEDTGVEGYTGGLVFSLYNYSSNLQSGEYYGSSYDGDFDYYAGQYQELYPTPDGVSSWFVPSYDQWKQMFVACGAEYSDSNEQYYGDFWTMLGNISDYAGSNYICSYYWAGPDSNGNNDYYYLSNNGEYGYFNSTSSGDSNYYRFCFAF